MIVNTTSNSGQGHYGNAAYSAAKEGVIGFTRAIARDLGPHGIRANAIRPAAFSKPGKDPMIAKLVEAEVRHGFPTVGDLWISRLDPAADWRPVHIANFVAWLCTEKAKAFNGEEFEIHGARIGVLAPSHVDRAVFQPGDWSIEALKAGGYPDWTHDQSVCGHAVRWERHTRKRLRSADQITYRSRDDPRCRTGPAVFR